MSSLFDAPFGDIGELKYTTIGEHVEFLTGPAFDSEKFNEEGMGPRLARGINITKGRTRWPKVNTKYWNDLTYELEKYLLKKGDILIGMDGSLVGRNFAAVTKDDLPCLLVQRVARLRAGDNLDGKYLYHLIASDSWLDYVDVVKTNSGIPHISNGDIKFFSVPFHPLEQQKKIAKILSTVDNLIEKTQTLIDKYTAIKQGMMADLFTRGIDMTSGDTPNSKGSKLRPSVEDAPELYKQTELGWVPKEWEVVEIDEICTQMTNGFVGVATPFYANESEEGVRYLYGNNVRANKLELHKVLTIKPEFHEKLRKSQLKRGDMLTVQSGHIGTSSVVPDNFGEANCHALIITRFIQSRVIPEFVSYYLNSAIGMNRMEEIFVGSTIKHVNVKELKEFEIPLPSLEEQVRFISRIDQTLSLISAEEMQLDKLKNQKKGLMQDLLTGKVKVV